MSVDKIKHTGAINQNGNGTKKSADGSDEFKKLLENYIEATKIHNPDGNKNKNAILENTLNHDAYNSFNKLKINHIDSNENSAIVRQILSEKSEIRADKLNKIKQRLEEGFYKRDDIIQVTAGKVLDSLGY